MKSLNNNDIEMQVYNLAVVSTSPIYRIGIRLKHVPTEVEVFVKGKAHFETKNRAVEELYKRVDEKLQDKEEKMDNNGLEKC